MGCADVLGGQVSATGTIELQTGLQIALDVRTDQPADLYELEVCLR